MVSEVNKEKLMNIIRDEQRISYRDVLRIVQPDPNDTSKSKMSPMTMNNGLKELVKDKKVIKEPDKIGGITYQFYSIPELTEHEKNIIVSFENELSKLKRLSVLITNQEFKSKSKNKQQKIEDEQNFAMQVLSIFVTHSMYLKSHYNYLEEYRDSPILDKGQQMFNDLRELYEKTKSTSNVEMSAFLSYIWQIRTQTFADDVDHIYDFYASEYNIELGNTDV
jgi:citrate synthase